MYNVDRREGMFAPCTAPKWRPVTGHYTGPGYLSVDSHKGNTGDHAQCPCAAGMTCHVMEQQRHAKRDTPLARGTFAGEGWDDHMQETDHRVHTAWPAPLRSTLA